MKTKNENELRVFFKEYGVECGMWRTSHDTMQMISYCRFACSRATSAFPLNVALCRYAAMQTCSSTQFHEDTICHLYQLRPNSTSPLTSQSTCHSVSSASSTSEPHSGQSLAVSSVIISALGTRVSTWPCSTTSSQTKPYPLQAAQVGIV